MILERGAPAPTLDLTRALPGGIHAMLALSTAPLPHPRPKPSPPRGRTTTIRLLSLAWGQCTCTIIQRGMAAYKRRRKCSSTTPQVGPVLSATPPPAPQPPRTDVELFPPSSTSLRLPAPPLLEPTMCFSRTYRLIHAEPTLALATRGQSLSPCRWPWRAGVPR